jgi:glycosyltransferase involved in cell wall biosynthesis/peptidoglycan/xylan/chitin deacetylase (PgdA/CDA1 family)
VQSPPVALAYHGVADVPLGDDVHRLFVSVGLLRSQIASLRRWGYEFVTFSRWAELVVAGRGRGFTALTFDDGFADNLQTLVPLLHELDVPATVFVVSGRLGERHWAYPDARLLTADELRELHAARVEIGAHTRTHADLSQLTYAAARRELEGSRSDLEDLLGAAVTTAAYPFGRASPDTIRAARDAGLAAACRALGLGRCDDPYDLPRQDVGNRATQLGLWLKREGRYTALMEHRSVRAARRLRLAALGAPLRPQRHLSRARPRAGERLAFVYHRIAPECLGGAERYYQTLCRTLAADGDATYITRHFWSGPSHVERDGVHIVAVGRAHARSDQARGRFSDKIEFAAGLVVHLVRHGGDYDVVHVCCFPHVGVIAARAGLLRHPDVRLVVDWHEVVPRESWRRRLGVLGELGWITQAAALRIGDAAVTFSRLHARRLEEEGCSAPVRIVPEFHPDGDTVRSGANGAREPLILFAGRLVPEKRPELIPGVLAALRRRDRSWRAMIFGAGPSEASVRAAVQHHGLADSVDLPGFVPWQEVGRAMERASALVLPTVREGFGLAVLEAAAHGLPSVLVDAPDNAAVELVENGRNGLVVDDPSPESLAGAVLALAARPDVHRSTRAWYEETSRLLNPRETAAALRSLHRELGAMRR